MTSVEAGDRRRDAERARPPARGREADGGDAARPSDIPARGWLDIVKRTRKGIKDDNVTLIAAGVAFYSMLAIFPALIAVVTIYGLVAEPTDVQRQVDSFAESMPPGAGTCSRRSSNRSLRRVSAACRSRWRSASRPRCGRLGRDPVAHQGAQHHLRRAGDTGLHQAPRAGPGADDRGHGRGPRRARPDRRAAGGAGRGRPAGEPASWPSPSGAGRPWSSWSRSPWPCSTASVPTGPTRGSAG